MHLKPDGMTFPANALRFLLIRYNTFSRESVKNSIKIHSIHKNAFN